jgi:MFS-type transporter involved in bile tolerance (Atg22 family)
MYTQSDYEQYYVIASLTGLVIGSTPALSRGYLSKIIPPEKRAELFGFNALASRIAALIGPADIRSDCEPL